MRALVRFHAENKFLLMAYNQKQLRELGRIVANPEKAPFDQVIEQYEGHFHSALARPPRTTSVINVLEHVSGYFSEQLSRAEKAFYRSALGKYRAGRLPLSAVTSILRAWIVRFENEYLLPQSFFEPYPEPLRSLSDSGKGRDV